MYDLLKFYHDLLIEKLYVLRGKALYQYDGTPLSMLKHEEHIKEILKTVISILNRQKRRVIMFDIGAYIGDYTVYLAPLCYIVIAIEAHPGNFNKLLTRVSHLNNVVLLNYAVSKFDGEVELFVREPTTHSIVYRKRARNVIKVKSVNLSSLITSILRRVRAEALVVKMDIEGAELKVFEGLRNSTMIYPTIIVVEVHGIKNKLILPILSYLKGFKVKFVDRGHIILIKGGGLNV